MHARQFAGLLLSSLIGIAVASGCGGSERAASTAQGPTDDGVSLYIERGGNAQINGALQSAFVAAGYTVVNAATAPHEVTLRATATAGIEQSIFQVQVNGVAKVNLRVTVSVTAVLPDGRVVDQASTEYVAGADEPATEERMRPIVQALRSSGRLAVAARAVRQTRDADARQQRAAAEQADRAKAAADEAARKQKHTDDEAAWHAANESTCATAAATNACLELQAWLKANPGSEHAAQAKQTLDAAVPKLSELNAAIAWDKANTQACKAPQKSSDCDGVTAYLEAFPTGAHADDARALRDAAWKKIEGLRRQEEATAVAQRKREEALAEAEAQREIQRQKAEEQRQKTEELMACRANCISKDGFCGVHADPQKFQRCAGLCIQRRCK